LDYTLIWAQFLPSKAMPVYYFVSHLWCDTIWSKKS